MSSTEQAALVGALCWHVPDLLPVMQESLDYNDELLSHLVMGDITRWVLARYEDDASDDALRRTLDFIEDAFVHGTSGGAQELIHVSFLENLPRPGEKGFHVVKMLGRNLQEQLKLMDPRYE